MTVCPQILVIKITVTLASSGYFFACLPMENPNINTVKHKLITATTSSIVMGNTPFSVAIRKYLRNARWRAAKTLRRGQTAYRWQHLGFNYSKIQSSPQYSRTNIKANKL